MDETKKTRIRESFHVMVFMQVVEVEQKIKSNIRFLSIDRMIPPRIALSITKTYHPFLIS
jgi:hypothetical protein